MSDPEAEALLARNSKRVILLIGVFLALGVLWAWQAPLDEVTTGQGKVVPTTQEQSVQSLEGGIVSEVLVRPDETVEIGQVVARLNTQATEAGVEEIRAQLLAKYATIARLTAEVNEEEIIFHEALWPYPALMDEARRLFEERVFAYERAASLLDEAYALLTEELEPLEGLVARGAVARSTMIQLKREVVQNRMQKDDLYRAHFVAGREALSEATTEAAALSAELARRLDQLQRMELRSPVHGIVKQVAVSTLGGVVPPSGEVMTIVPIEEELLVETKILPENIALIHPQMPAVIKITAYDPAIYGTLEGEVVSISPDSIQDEVDRSVQYYRVFVRSKQDALITPQGRKFPISPGMLATVDIHSGQKTVLQYLLKPLNRAGEAMRER